MGRRKWKLYQEVLARSHLNANHSTASAAVANVATPANDITTDGHNVHNDDTVNIISTSIATNFNNCIPPQPAETSTSESGRFATTNQNKSLLLPFRFARAHLHPSNARCKLQQRLHDTALNDDHTAVAAVAAAVDDFLDPERVNDQPSQPYRKSPAATFPVARCRTTIRVAAGRPRRGVHQRPAAPKHAVVAVAQPQVYERFATRRRGNARFAAGVNDDITATASAAVASDRYDGDRRHQTGTGR